MIDNDEIKSALMEAVKGTMVEVLTARGELREEILERACAQVIKASLDNTRGLDDYIARGARDDGHR